MRSVFHQYTQPENRLTHALACTLDEDRTLLATFLRWAGCEDAPPISTLAVTQQQVPGKYLPGDEVEGTRKGLPDACIFNHDGWALLIESKISAPVDVDQLKRHQQTAAHHQFRGARVLLLTVDPPHRDIPAGVIWREWREVYAFMVAKSAESTWAERLSRYFEVFESDMIARDYSVRGTLTMFTGVRFDTENPYSYGEAKRLLRLMCDELQGRHELHELGVRPCEPRRGSIKDSDAGFVWDILPLFRTAEKTNFTSVPHLTVGVHADKVSAAMTLPNGYRELKSRFTGLERNAFTNALKFVEDRAAQIVDRIEGARVILRAEQRTFYAQRIPIPIAHLDVDLITRLPNGRRGPRFMGEWIEAVNRAFANKKGNNLQLQVRFHLPYSTGCTRTPTLLDMMTECFVATEPLLRFAVGEPTAS